MKVLRVKKLLITLSSLVALGCTTVSIRDTKFYCKLKVEPVIAICNNEGSVSNCKEDQGIERFSVIKLNTLHIKEVCKF